MKNKLSLYLLLSALIVVGFVAPVFADHHEGDHKKEEHKDGEHHDGDHHEEKK
jgi:hypothetical protein